MVSIILLTPLTHLVMINGKTLSEQTKATLILEKPTFQNYKTYREKHKNRLVNGNLCSIRVKKKFRNRIEMFLEQDPSLENLISYIRQGIQEIQM